MPRLFLLLFALMIIGCCAGLRAQEAFSLHSALRSELQLKGKKDNGHYLYTTAGDRLYAIGDQAGRFPATGWHVPGEMGGIWQQPIKLLDGFRIAVADGAGNPIELSACEGFTTYPFSTSFTYSAAGCSIVRTQFVPDGKPVMVVELSVSNNTDTAKKLAFRFTADINLRPVWLGERSGMIDTTDEIMRFDSVGAILTARDNRNTWFAAISSDAKAVTMLAAGKTPYTGKGLSVTLSVPVTLPQNSTKAFRFYIGGSLASASEATQSVVEVQHNLRALFAKKRQRYHEIDSIAAIDIPDSGIAQAYRWGKYSGDWLVREVPGLGRAMSAGLPDYPWFFSNDQATTFNGLLGTVKSDILFSSWRMLKALSEKVNDNSGRIMHEASTNGEVYDKGRMEESQLHITTAWNIFRWTGDLPFLRENYEYGKKIWAWLQQHDTNRNGYIEGYGGVEIEGLNAEMLDVQVRTQGFLSAMADMAAVVADTAAAVGYTQRASQLKKMIDADWWIPEEKRFADFLAPAAKALNVIDTALARRTDTMRNAWAFRKLTNLRAQVAAGSYRNKGYAVYYTTSGLLPVQEGIATRPQADSMLSSISRFTNKFGMYISGIERPDDVSTDESSFRHDATFNYNRAVMPVATAALIIGACRYGYADTALKYMHSLLNSFGYATPGTTYEVSPDYGMFVQAWNTTGFDIPLVQYFFGIDPMAVRREIKIRPNLPSSWKKCAISNVIIGDNRLSVHIQKTGKLTEFLLRSRQPGWRIRLAVPEKANVTVNGRAVRATNEVTVTGKMNRVTISPNAR